MGLKESLPLLPPEEPAGPGLPPWLVESFTTPEKAVSLALEAPVDLQVRVNPVRARASDIGRLKAEKFGELLKKGVKPSEAAHRLHTTVRALMSKEQTRKTVTEIIENYTLDATARRLLQRALVNKGVIENAGEKGDPELLKEYLKMLGKDTEVGIEAPPQVGIVVGLDKSVKELLDSTIPIPELPPAQDAEFEDVKDKNDTSTTIEQ